MGWYEARSDSFKCDYGGFDRGVGLFCAGGYCGGISVGDNGAAGVFTTVDSSAGADVFYGGAGVFLVFECKKAD